MRNARRTVLASGFVVTTLIACVGGPGSLPSGDEQNPDVEQQGSQGGSGSGSAQGGGSGSGQGSTGNGTTTTDPPSTKSQTISVAEFDRSCSVDSDCILVVQGSVCSPCQCPGGSMAVKDKASYDAAFADRSKDCPEQGDVQCAPCSTSLVAACNGSKQCSIGVAKADAG